MRAQGNSFLLHVTVLKTIEEELQNTGQVLNTFTEKSVQYPVDQFIWLIYDQKSAVWYLRFWNRDGSSAKACGNGTRCAAHILYRLGYVGSEVLFQGPIGPLRALIEEQTPNTSETFQTVTVCQGEGRFVSLQAIKKLFTQAEWEYFKETKKKEGYLRGVDIGNLHMVVLGARDPVSSIQAYEEHRSSQRKYFYGYHGINISYVGYSTSKKATIATWEKGVGPTLSCGSAACAALMVLAERYSIDKVTLQFPGGPITVTYCIKEGYCHTAPSYYSHSL